MTGKTHAACGAATMLALTVLHRSGLPIGAETYTPAIGLLTVVVGSYAPDVDLKNSTLGQKLRMISHLFRHRGLTHTLLFPVLLTLLMMGLKAQGMAVVPELLLGFNVGWVTHIIADAFNHQGVPILWPIVRKKLHVASVHIGTWQESAFLWAWLIVTLLLTVSKLLGS